MPFRNLIDSGSFPPEALQVMYKAFDLAWKDISPRFDESASRTSFARDTLARAVLLASEQADLEDAEALKSSALAIFDKKINSSAG